MSVPPKICFTSSFNKLISASWVEVYFLITMENLEQADCTVCRVHCSEAQDARGPGNCPIGPPMNCQNCNALHFEDAHHCTLRQCHSTALCMSFPLCTELWCILHHCTFFHCNWTNCNWRGAKFRNCTTAAASVAAGDQFSRSAGSEASGVSSSAVHWLQGGTASQGLNNIYNNALSAATGQ